VARATAGVAAEPAAALSSFGFSAFHPLAGPTEPIYRLSARGMTAPKPDLRRLQLTQLGSFKPILQAERDMAVKKLTVDKGAVSPAAERAVFSGPYRHLSWYSMDRRHNNCAHLVWSRHYPLGRRLDRRVSAVRRNVALACLSRRGTACHLRPTERDTTPMACDSSCLSSARNHPSKNSALAAAKAQ
jgi:hypothetical protein